MQQRHGIGEPKEAVLMVRGIRWSFWTPEWAIERIEGNLYTTFCAIARLRRLDLRLLARELACLATDWQSLCYWHWLLAEQVVLLANSALTPSALSFTRCCRIGRANYAISYWQSKLCYWRLHVSMRLTYLHIVVIVDRFPSWT